jgi:hypothetical protein
VVALRWIALAALIGLAAGQAATAGADPMDLLDTGPRTVYVRFEVSPASHPGQRDAVYTRAFAARLEPGPGPGEVQVTVPGHVVEQHLLPNQRPRPGSFSDFVWIFDAETGHVRSATVSGTLVHRVGGSLASWDVDASIQVKMDTLSTAGFRSPGRVMGRMVHRFCADTDASRCTLVPARSFDPASGYVNAVGDVMARSGPLRVHSFSPLGEAIFSEADDRPQQRIAAEASPLPAVSSGPHLP